MEAAQLADRDAVPEREQARIIALSLERGVASRYTAFVVLETSSDARVAKTPAEARPIPVNAPAGWGMFQADEPADAFLVHAAPAAFPAPASRAMAMSPMAAPSPRRRAGFLGRAHQPDSTAVLSSDVVRGMDVQAH
jgi:Ca-activated chloride channel family protein